ncbi:unnamed protein product [Ascophyllum nodosum]
MISATMRPETFMRSGKLSASRPARRTRSGQGIIEANRKTEICRHWLAGACPFGGKCAFAHGAHELRAPSIDMERTGRNGMTSKMFQVQSTRYDSKSDGDAMARCCSLRCTAHTNGRMLNMGNSQLLRCSPSDGHVHIRNHCGQAGCPPVTSQQGHTCKNASLPSSSIKCDCFRPESIKQKQDSVNDGDGIRGAFSLWQSPITLPSSCLGRGGHAKDVNTIMDRVSRGACSRTKMDVTAASNKDVTFTSAMTQSSVRATNRENETWAKIARRGFGEGPTYAAPCHFEDNRGSLKDTCIHCIASAAHVANAGKACATASRFSLFHGQRGNIPTSTSVIGEPSSSGESTSAAPPATPTADAAAGWDSSLLQTPASSSSNPGLFCTVNQKETSSSKPCGISGQSGMDEDGSLANMVSSFLLESSKPEPVHRAGDRLQRRPAPPLLATECSTRDGQWEAQESSGLSCAQFSTRFQDDSTTNSIATQTYDGEAGVFNKAWHPLLHLYNHSGPSPQDGMFKAIANIPSTSHEAAFHRHLNSPTNGPGASAGTSPTFW